MTASSVMVNSIESTAAIPELSTFMYLAVLAGNPVEHVAARYGVTPTHAAERIEAARLCYELQVNMPGFPLHLL